MAVILNIETASKYCSIAVLAEDKIFYEKKSSVGQSHSSILGIFVKDALEKLKICEKSLDAVAVSSGPGSYTGLRIGASLAKGLCFGLSIPLIAVPTLKILAAAGLNALKTDENRNSLIVCPMLDARRMEVYSALYDADLNEIRPAMAEIIDEKSYTC
ncbi:MAG: tRNA (adenosine(37)-N6)-threonylcarbamoyltransferase complex dimerization subunit type 1 TsaB, partial [Dysgonamonadaceae bacterium]|nr:tRNA (adenosine(37)-N6)-threonylcarbamoyltransferase complex dimerization subunit type 1 TsaB [Dysgonamonadaceae bacterium]